MKKFVMLACLLLISTPLLAADWKVIATAQDGAIVSINQDQISRDQVTGIVYVPVSWVYALGKVEDNWVYNEAVGQRFYNCKTHQSATRQVIFYSGAVVVNKSDDVMTPWKDILPSTIAAYILKVVCPGTQT